MTVIEIIDRIRNWCEKEICQKTELKLPPQDKAPITHEVEFVHPQAFALYVPAKDRIPPNVKAPIPSLCVQLMEGEDKLIDGRRRISVRLCLAAWNPGYQSEEVFMPHDDTAQDVSRHWTQGDPDNQVYARNFDGWRDIWNFTDKALRAIEGTSTIDGLAIVQEEGVKYGPFQEDGTIWDYYPYWHSWITFTLECGLVRGIPKEQQEFL